MSKNPSAVLLLMFGTTFWLGCASPVSSSVDEYKISDSISTIDSNYRKVDYDSTILLVEKKKEGDITWDEDFSTKELIT